MRISYSANPARALFVTLALFCMTGVTQVNAADVPSRYGVTFGQQGNEVKIQVVPARSGLATNTMPKPGDSAITAIVGAPEDKQTAAVSPKAPGTAVQLKSQSVADYKEDGFDVSIDDIEGASTMGELETTGKLSLAILFQANTFALDLTDSTTLAALNKLLKMMKTQPNLVITIEGYVDYIAVFEEYYTPDGGQATSEQRAYDVKQWLVDNGIASARINYVGKGARGASGDSTEQRALNRRVDITKTSE